MSHKLTDFRGYTVLECIFALLLFALIFPPLVSVWAVQKRVAEQSMRRVAAQNIGKMVMDEVRNVGYAGVDSMQARPVTERTLELSVSRGGPVETQTYLWEVDVTTPAQLPGLYPNEKRVSVKVQWNESSQAKDLTMATIINSGI